MSVTSLQLAGLVLLFAVDVALAALNVRARWKHELPSGEEQLGYRLVWSFGAGVGTLLMGLWTVLTLTQNAAGVYGAFCALGMDCAVGLFLTCNMFAEGTKDQCMTLQNETKTLALSMLIPFGWPLSATCMVNVSTIHALQSFLVLVQWGVGSLLMLRLIRYDAGASKLSKACAALSIALLLGITVYSTLLDYEESMITTVYLLFVMLVATNYGEENYDPMLKALLLYPLLWVLAMLCLRNGLVLSFLASLAPSVLLAVCFFGEDLFEHLAGGQIIWTLTSFVYLLVGRPSCSGTILWGSSSTTDAVNTKIRQILQLNQKMPLWLTFLVAGIKPIIMLKVFGKNSKNPEAKEGPCWKLYMIGPFFSALAMVSLASDIAQLRHLSAAAELTGWAEINAVVMLGAVSSNMQTGIAFCAILFNNLVGPREGLCQAFKKMMSLQGGMWVFVMSAVAAIYLPWLLLIIAYILPGVFFYCWGSIPMVMVVVRYWDHLAKATAGSYAGWLLGEDELANNEKNHLETATAGSYAELLGEDEFANNEKKGGGKKWHESEKTARSVSLVAPLVGAFIPILVPIVARFYLGEGYLGAITTTWEDRHVPDFITSLTSTATHSLHTAQEVSLKIGAGDLNGFFKVAIIWVQTLNYIF